MLLPSQGDFESAVHRFSGEYVPDSYAENRRHGAGSCCPDIPPVIEEQVDLSCQAAEEAEFCSDVGFRFHFRLDPVGRQGSFGLAVQYGGAGKDIVVPCPVELYVHIIAESIVLPGKAVGPSEFQIVYSRTVPQEILFRDYPPGRDCRIESEFVPLRKFAAARICAGYAQKVFAGIAVICCKYVVMVHKCLVGSGVGQPVPVEQSGRFDGMFAESSVPEQFYPHVTLHVLGGYSRVERYLGVIAVLAEPVSGNIPGIVPDFLWDII